MRRHSSAAKDLVRDLRAKGKTFTEIKNELNINFAKSTLSVWCKNVVLPIEYKQKVQKLNATHLKKAREIADKTNQNKRAEFLTSLDIINQVIAIEIRNKSTAKIALSMLCLGEASKYKSGRTAFTLGNSDPRVIILFIELMKQCFEFNINKVRCTVQCRADQNVSELELYWQNITGIPRHLFYKARIDPRTIGKPTKNKNYRGVLRIDYLDLKVQLELESLAKLVYNHMPGARRTLVV